MANAFLLRHSPPHSLSPSPALPNPTPNRMRSGTIWTVLAHIITAAIGSGVVSLAWSMSKLGWIAGPLTMLAFAFVTLASAFHLCNCYISSDLNEGVLCRNVSYLDAVQRILGKRNARFCSVIVQINLIKLGIVYTITSSISMSAIQRSNCYHMKGHTSPCEYKATYYTLIFGIVEVLLSQIPDFRNTKWLSVIAAIMSFTYSTIGVALSLAKVIENGEIQGSIGGVSASAADKVWSVSQAIGDIAFAFPFSIVFLEIMDTLKPNPPENITMRKASIAAVCITSFFYMCCGGLGYAAFGNSTPGNLLTGFGFYEPFWLIDLANACIVIHLIGAYQVFSQPLYVSFELWSAKLFSISSPEPGSRLNVHRLCVRTAYVGLTTGVAALFPYFNEVVGVSGAITFWPVVMYFPVEMYLVQKNLGRWTRRWVLLKMCSLIGLVVMVFAFVGSVKGLISKMANI